MCFKGIMAALAAALILVLSAAEAQAETLAWYRFEDGLPGQTVSVATDELGGVGQNGTPQGSPILFVSDAPPIAGSSANNLSVSFNGALGQSILFSYMFPLHLSGPATLEFFVKFNHTNHHAIIWSRPDSSDTNRFNIWTTHPGTGPSFGFDYRAPDRTIHKIANPIAFAVELGEWTHVAITRNGDTYEWFKNGVSMGSWTDTLPDLPTSLGWQMSGRWGCDYNGLLDEVRISDRALSPREFLYRSTLVVDIDIKPGSDPNCFNINGSGVIPVAILGDADFDVTDIDTSSLSFDGLAVRVRGKKGPLCSFEYSNADSYIDLVCHFEDDAGYWIGGGDIGTVTGLLLDDTPFEGADSICIVP
jgi:hypothetical protein